jgi:hypothetical protein
VVGPGEPVVGVPVVGVPVVGLPVVGVPVVGEPVVGVPVVGVPVVGDDVLGVGVGEGVTVPASVLPPRQPAVSSPRTARATVACRAVPHPPRTDPTPRHA